MTTVHLSDIVLSEYHLGLLSAKEKRAVRQHLAECALCTMDHAILEDYMASLASSLPPAHIPSEGHVQLGIVGRIREMVASLVNQPRMVLAGEVDDDETEIYEVGDIQIRLTSLEDFDIPSRRVLLGLLIGTKTEQMQAYLWQTDHPDVVAVSEVDPWGNFLIPNLAEATYELILGDPEREIRIHNIRA